jgi:hypothetical protein
MTRIRGKHTPALTALWAVAVVASLVVGTNASAVPVGALATTGDALDSGGPDAGYWRGSHELTGTNNTFTGTLDFAVFGPGDFQSFLDATYGGGAYSDPTGGGEYIYAFQFRSDSGSPIQALNVGYDLGADIGSLPAPASAAGSGDETPNATAYNATSARWDWGFADSVAGGQISDVLFYSSNRPPKPDFATLGAQYLLDQADSGPGDYASPSVPEPTTLASLLIVLVGLGLQAPRRR